MNVMHGLYKKQMTRLGCSNLADYVAALRERGSLQHAEHVIQQTMLFRVLESDGSESIKLIDGSAIK